MKWSAVGAELKKLRKNLSKQKPIVKVGIGALSLVAVLAISYLIFSLAYLGKVYPRVVVGGVSFGGLTISQVEEKLDTLISNSPKTVTLRHNDETQQLGQEEVDWSYNIKETAQDIYIIGRNPSSRWDGLIEQISSLFVSKTIAPVVSYDDQAIDLAISTFAAAVDQPAVDATARYINDDLIITKEQVGKTINRKEVESKIIHSWSNFLEENIIIKTHFDAPKIVLSNEEELRKSAEVLSLQKLTIKWPGKTRALKTREIKQLIGFIGVAPEFPSTEEAPSQENLTADFTILQAKNYLRVLAETVNKPAEEPKLIISNGKLAIAANSKKGKVIDLVSSSRVIVDTMKANIGSLVVELTLKEQEPVITEANLDKLGIKERIGYGETNFAGSPSNRRHNISNGVQTLQSALLKPGEEFSTVATLGAVDNTTGYLPELVIKENRTVPEYGGGLCQVSTTLFRSVLDAGLEVTERRNHSYRVSYYEPPIGLDATIYLPKPDLRFVNNTSAHVLVQGRVVGSKVIFELWGTDDGREVTVSTPQILSTTPPGEPIYAETDTLPLGEQKQIEKAHDGAVAIAYYTVKLNGETIVKQTFRSVYKAWPARFLVGTNPNLPPSDPPPEA